MGQNTLPTCSTHLLVSVLVVCTFLQKCPVCRHPCGAATDKRSRRAGKGPTRMFVVDLELKGRKSRAVSSYQYFDIVKY